MGCDIHVHTELKIKGVWHHFGNPRIERWYALFAKMADVRNQPHWGIVPIKGVHRGLPDNATEMTRISFENEEHDDRVFWLDLDQIKELVNWFERTFGPDEHPHGLEGEFGYVFGNGWAGLPTDVVEDSRFVFWFDN